MLLLTGPLFNARRVEVVSFVAGQWCNHIRVFEVKQTNGALGVLVESLVVFDARHAFQGHAHRACHFRRIAKHVDHVRWESPFITAKA